MEDVLITYDVSIYTNFFGSEDNSLNSKVKSGMIAKGYSDSFRYNEEEYYLPNTTLWKPKTTPADAKKDLLEVASKCDATIERMIAVEFNNLFAAIEGEPF